MWDENLNLCKRVKNTGNVNYMVSIRYLILLLKSVLKIIKYLNKKLTMYDGIYNKHIIKICDNNSTRVRRGEMKVYYLKDLLLYVR